MATGAIPDRSTPFGERVQRRLSEETVVWFTSVGRDGTPQPNPVWFLWEGDDRILTYNRPAAHRLVHIRRRPRVSLNLNSGGQGSDIIVLTGDAEVLDDHPPAADHPAYLEKYRGGMEQVAGSPEAFARAFSVPVRIHITRVRGV